MSTLEDKEKTINEVLDDIEKADLGFVTLLNGMIKKNACKIDEIKRQIELTKKLSTISEECATKEFEKISCKLSAAEKENNKSLLVLKTKFVEDEIKKRKFADMIVETKLDSSEDILEEAEKRRKIEDMLFTNLISDTTDEEDDEEDDEDEED